ncbi:MAG: methyltransferase domain-containing protein [Pseudomonadota bacterium]
MSRQVSTQPAVHEQSVALTRDFRLLQKRRGHRYSVDDMLVAHLAATHALSDESTEPRQVLDLGCGLGSVLLILAWAYPQATFIGLEVLEEHVSYARRNILLNGCGGRARVVAGDLRDLSLVATLGRFDLVTGSPPYFAQGTGTVCADPARAAAHFELCGGIEDYAAAASRALAPGGLFVTCAAADPPHRAEAALAQAGLTLLYRRAVVPRAGKPPFLQLLVGGAGRETCCTEGQTLILRQADGHRSAEHRAIRRWTGL